MNGSRKAKLPTGFVSPDRDQLERIRSSLADRYAVEAEVGRGGMGIVYLARDLRLDRAVAVKILPPIAALSEINRQAFLREARLAASLSHPNIVPIHSLEEPDDMVCIVMEYVRGRSLRERMEGGDPPELESSLRILRDVAWALDHAHARGVVHRDVKPSNIFLDEEDGRTLLGDFGIARGDYETLTLSGIGKGTPGFGSPEQMLGQDVDGRSDLYGLGATAWFMFTGRAPPAPTPAGPDLRAERPDIPTAIADLVTRCLAWDPDERPATAREAASVLAAELTDERLIPERILLWMQEPRAVTILLIAVTAIIALSPRALIGDPELVIGLLALWLSYFSYRCYRTLPVVRQGYRRADLLSYLRVWSTHRMWARPAQSRGPTPSKGLATSVRWLTAGVYTALFTVGVLVADVTDDPHPASPLDVIGIWSLLLLLVVGWVWPGLARGPDHLLTRLRVRFWKGPFGRAAWGGLARFGSWRSKESSRAGQVDRHTEFVLVDGVDWAFRRLPVGLQRDLSSVPDVVQRLEQHACNLRIGLQRLSGIRAELSPQMDDGTASSVAKLVESLDQERERLKSRRLAVMRALQQIRIGLLGLAAHAETPAGLRDTLEEAHDIRTRLDEICTALQTAEELLRVPAPVLPGGSTG